MTVYWNILKASIEMASSAKRNKRAAKGYVREEDVINRALRWTAETDGFAKSDFKELDDFLGDLLPHEFKTVCGCVRDDSESPEYERQYNEVLTKYGHVVTSIEDIPILVDDMIHDLWSTVIPQKK